MYAQECGVTDKYIQILYKRIIVYLLIHLIRRKKYKTWLLDWLENYIEPTAKIRTYERYYQICALHIIPSLGNYKLAEISVIDLQKFITALLTNGNYKRGKGLSANFVISVLQNSLKTAHLIGLTLRSQIGCFLLV